MQFFAEYLLPEVFILLEEITLHGVCIKSQQFRLYRSTLPEPTQSRHRDETKISRNRRYFVNDFKKIPLKGQSIIEQDAR